MKTLRQLLWYFSPLEILILLPLALVGCGGYFGAASTRATQAAVDVVDSPKYKKELDDMAAEAAGAARDKMLDADTSAKLAAIRDNFIPPLRLQLQGVPDDLLGPHTRRLTLSLVDRSLADVNGYFAQWRETAFGQPLRDDLAQLVASAKPQIADLASTASAAAASPIKVTVDTETSKLKTDVEWAAVLFALAALVYAVESHRRAVAKLLDRLEAK